MRKFVKLILAAVLCVPMLSLGVATAETGTNSTGNNTGETSKPSSDSGSTEDKTTLEQRQQKRKDELKLKLSKLEEDKIKLKCKAGQVPVKNLSGRIKGLETSRNEVYKNLVDRLTKVSAQLKERGLNTTTLDAQIVTLKTKIDTFKTDLAAYKQAVSDLASLDCVSDPTGFKAALETARADREKLTKDATDIKTYVVGTIKPTLVALRSQLEAKDKVEGTNSTEGNQ